MTDREYLTLRRDIIKKDYGGMNDRQFEAVTTVNGPLLVLAGAGSGKTTVLVNRISYLVKYGNAFESESVHACSEQEAADAKAFLRGDSAFLPQGVFADHPVNPYHILAITFTNKAAGELKSRIAARLGEDGTDIWAGTFHSVCGKMLRRFADRIGYSSHFTVYDTDDQRRLMKELVKAQGVDDKVFSPKAVLSEISSAKDKLIDALAYEQQAGDDYRKKTVAMLYKLYTKRLRDADAMDFDDMIVNTVRLLKENPDILDYYGEKFHYIMVDEYQDTNYAQYMLVKLLAAKHGNICVVGDDDQSIYRFRGATIENILNFEKHYANAKVIRLEQNYRSTSYILDAANAVIAHNKGRKGKTLWTDNGQGEAITVYAANDQQDEARFVSDRILEDVQHGGRFADHAVLYRMNAQSNVIENVFSRSGIPYQVIGGLRFFDRKEVKDILSYLHVIDNPQDDVRLKRIINEPKRGIGDTTVTKATEIAEHLGLSLFEVFCHADEYAALSRSASRLMEFTRLITDIRESAGVMSVHELAETVSDRSGYLTALMLEGKEGIDRIENVKELSSSIVQYELENDEPTLSGFLEEVALVSDLDAMDADSDRVIMMTIHSAKGLEFDHVYLVGWEEGVFPGNQSIYSGPEELEEERRLAYVAITRAKKQLVISNTYIRMLYGATNRNLPSRFLKEIPDELCVHLGRTASPADSFITDILRSAPQRDSTQSYTRSAGGFSSYLDTRSAAKPAQALPYKVGQTVEHATFGQGVIEKMVPMGSDTLLEVQFERIGLKKLMAGYTKLKVIS